MTQEDKDALTGRLVREHKEANEHLATLGAEARKIGEHLAGLAEALQFHPEGVVPSTESLDVQFSRFRYPFDSSALDAPKLKLLTAEYRATLLKKEQLESQLRQMGYQVGGP